MLSPWQELGRGVSERLRGGFGRRGSVRFRVLPRRIRLRSRVIELVSGNYAWEETRIRYLEGRGRGLFERGTLYSNRRHRGCGLKVRAMQPQPRAIVIW